MEAAEQRQEDEPSGTVRAPDRFWEREEELRRLLHEEQSLRNVATLLATAGPAEDILTAICQEASAQLDGQEVSLLRFETPEVVVAVASHGGPIPPGVRAVHSAGSLMDLVARMQQPVRVDDFAGHSDEELIRPFGIRAAVAVPVFVEGEVWGMFSASSQTGPLPAFTENRLAGFAQLTWTAIANTQVREDLRRLADEQAAIRQVAELVARESPSRSCSTRSSMPSGPCTPRTSSSPCTASRRPMSRRSWPKRARPCSATAGG